MSVLSRTLQWLKLPSKNPCFLLIKPNPKFRHMVYMRFAEPDPKPIYFMRFETALNPIWVDIIHENYTALIWSRYGSRISSPVVKSDQPRSTQWIQIRSTAENRETLGDALITIMDKFPKYDFRTEKCANEAISEMEGLLGPITTSDVWSKEKDG